MSKFKEFIRWIKKPDIAIGIILILLSIFVIFISGFGIFTVGDIGADLSAKIIMEIYFVSTILLAVLVITGLF